MCSEVIQENTSVRFDIFSSTTFPLDNTFNDFFLSFAAFSCPYCARIPLARKKIRKHICRHFKDYFASLALKSGKFLVCKDCLVKSLGNAEARPFVTGVVLNIFFFQSCPACLCTKAGFFVRFEGNSIFTKNNPPKLEIFSQTSIFLQFCQEKP